MLRMMVAACLCLIALPIASCGDRIPIDLCKHAAVRRQVYTTSIIAADAFIASGRPVPPAVTVGREAAITARAVLDANCPAAR